MATTLTPATKRPKKACTQCRQQKARCDAYLRPADDPCSRCKRLSLECVIMDRFEREHKRRKLYQLQNETQQLRERLRESSGDRHTTSASPPRRDGVITQRSPEASISSSDRVKPTLPRILDGFILESDEIDQLFHLFFCDYSLFLPILDPDTTPNYYYEASIPLFWAIIGVASRRYEPKPTLIKTMASKVVDLVLLSIKSRVTIRTVQTLLLLLTWPFLQEGGAPEPTFLLNGTMLHLAMQLGLHTPIFSQEFSKDRLDLTPEDVNTRAVLWGYCVMTYQRRCTMKGSPSFALADMTLDPDQREKLMAVLPGDLKFQLRAQDIVVRCSNVLAKNGLHTMSKDQERGMDMTVDAFIAQLQEVQDSTPLSTTSAFARILTRLCIRSFYFYQESAQWSQKADIIFELISDASDVIQGLEQADDHLPTARPWYLLHGLLMANSVLLRLCKNPPASSCTYRESAASLLRRGILILKQMSVEPTDLSARASNIFTQLLESSKAFIHPDSPPGEPQGVPLRIRSRLATSAVLDAWVWWREEFGGYSGVYPTPLKEKRTSRATIAQTRDGMDAHNAGMQTNGLAVTALPDKVASTSLDVETFNYANPAYSSGPYMDPSPLAAPGAYLQDDIFADIWTCWPDEGWGIPGLS